MAAESDVPAIVDFYTLNRDFLAPWEPARPEGFLSESWWRDMVKKSIADFAADRAMRLFMFPSAGGNAVLGSINFTNFIRGAFHACFLGYALAEREQGKGLMTEALTACLPCVFHELGMHRVMANYMPRNERSGRLLERLGFTREGEARDYLLINGRWEDHVLTSRVNPDWDYPGR
jgi:ribosomal-protein-alanine N-acetyltransferase